MDSSEIIGLIIAVIFFLYYINKKSPKKNLAAKQKEYAFIFYDFILERKKEIFTNILSNNHSMWRIEIETTALLVEAQKMNLFPFEIIKKFVPYANSLMWLDIENEIAKKDIVELEKYFYNFLT